MARLEDFFYAEPITQRIIIPQKGMPYLLGGIVYGRPGFPDGSLIVTSPVQKQDGSVVTTASSQEYILGNMHEDYKELLDVHASGLPIICCWRIEGNRRNKYHIHGKLLGSDKIIFGKVERQYNNYIWVNATQYYVIWHNWELSEQEQNEIERFSIYCDIQLAHFEPYVGNPHARPFLL